MMDNMAWMWISVNNKFDDEDNLHVKSASIEDYWTALNKQVEDEAKKHPVTGKTAASSSGPP